MKKLTFAALFVAIVSIVGCNSDDDTWETYLDWYDANQAWLTEQRLRTNPDGTPYYTVLTPQWNTGVYVLIHYFNDRAETEGNLSPLYTSTIDTRYFLHLYDGTPIDSSVNSTSPAPGVFRTQLNATIQGWAVALSNMRCGDTAEVIVPYQIGYGTDASSVIPPYSALRFNIRLVDIPNYETRPE